MDKYLRNALNKVHAEDTLVEKTAARLSAKFRRRKRRWAVHIRLAAACASLLVLLAMGGFSLKLYLTPSAYIDIDVNPSIEMTTNRFGRVISEHAYNDDGGRILSEINVRNLSYPDAIDRLIDTMLQDGYLRQDGLVSVTVQAEDGALLQDVQTSVSASLQNHHLAAETDVFPVTQDVKTAAGEHHLSPAKYLAITELQQIDPTVTIEGCRHHTISELRQFAKEHAGGHEANDEDQADHEEEKCATETSASESSDANTAETPQPRSKDSREEHGDEHGSDHH